MTHSMTVPKLPFSVPELIKKINADWFLVIPLAVRTSRCIRIQLSTCVVGAGAVHYAWEEFGIIAAALRSEPDAQDAFSVCLKIKERQVKICWNSTDEFIIFNTHMDYTLEGEMATHSSILAWRISQTEEPGRLQSMGLQESQESDMT